MIKRKKFKPTEPLVLNYDQLWILPTKDKEYKALYGDTEYTFNDTEIDEICDKINAIGCTSFQLSKEELVALIEKIKGE